MALASGTVRSSNPRVFSTNSSSFTSSISDHPISQTPTIPKSFSGLCKPFHSRVPKSVSSPGNPIVDEASLSRLRLHSGNVQSKLFLRTVRLSSRKKILYLESIGIDSLSIESHPMLISVPLAEIKSIVEFMNSMDFTAIEFRRIFGMCPEVLTTQVSDIIPVVTFLIRETRVNGSDIKQVINQRPRLLVCGVSKQLRPILYFLQSIGIEEVNKHTYLLSCSVEEKLIPRTTYFEKIGFSRRDATSMFRRLPQLFCYSIKNNLEPKYNYFVVEMGRDLKELKKLPQYFSFSLENRNKPRHRLCVELGVCFPLPVLLKTSELQFHSRLYVCVNSSIP